MAFLYKGEHHNHVIVGMRPQWWGILGLIGWGYLTCALIYLITNGKLILANNCTHLFSLL